MKYQVAILKFFLLCLAMQANAGLDLTVVAERTIVYTGTKPRDGALQVTSVRDKGTLHQPPPDNYKILLRKHVGQIIEVGGRIRILREVDNNFVIFYNRIPVKIQPKDSAKIYCGIYITIGSLELYHVEDTQGSIIEKDSRKIATELNKHKDNTIYFTTDKYRIGELKDAVQSGNNVCVTYGPKTVKFSLGNFGPKLYKGQYKKHGWVSITEVCLFGNPLDLNEQHQYLKENCIEATLLFEDTTSKILCQVLPMQRDFFEIQYRDT